MSRLTTCMAYAALAVGLCSTDAGAQVPDAAAFVQLADSLAEAPTASGAIPGVSVAIARNGEVLLAKGYGLADLELAVPASAETIYRIGSLTKQFTAAAIMRLVDAGRIGIDDPITEYLPDYPLQGHHVSVHHLLSHTSGMADFRIRSVADLQRDLSYEDLIESFGDQPFEFAPGERYDYNNLGYRLLGEIIARVTEVPYAEHIEATLLEPLGLEQTYYCDARRVIPNRAEGYEQDDGEVVNAPQTNVAMPGAAAALCSSAGDLVRWMHLLNSGQVVSSASLSRMTTPIQLASGEAIPRGYGLYLDPMASQPRLHHGNRSAGFASYLAHYPDDGLTVVVLTNMGAARQAAFEMQEVLARRALEL